MKFIQLTNWTIINASEILKMEYEECEIGNRYYSYFILKNGEKYDGYDTPDTFQVDDEKDYIFCCWCHQMMNKIILYDILKSPIHIYSIEENEEKLWEIFIEKCRENMNKLRQKICVLPS